MSSFISPASSALPCIALSCLPYNQCTPAYHHEHGASLRYFAYSKSSMLCIYVFKSITPAQSDVPTAPAMLSHHGVPPPIPKIHHQVVDHSFNLFTDLIPLVYSPPTPKTHTHTRPLFLLSPFFSQPPACFFYI